MALGTTPNFEDVAIGSDIPGLEKGPLTTAHLMRWSAAMENWHKIHYDKPFAMEHDKLPGLLINGSLKQQFVMQMLAILSWLLARVMKLLKKLMVRNLIFLIKSIFA